MTERAKPRDAADLTTVQWPLGGYAPGHYMNTCRDCGDTVFNVDKRASQCLACAITMLKKLGGKNQHARS